jgi:hypothetical protein
MNYAFLRVVELLQTANSPGETAKAMALADKLPLDDQQRALLAQELIRATVRCKGCTS